MTKHGLPVEERFWMKVDRSGNCWNWTAATDENGYGYFRWHPKNSAIRAHRYSYILANGPVAPGHKVDHKCHNETCVNPAHLREVTNKQNMENRSGTPRHNTSGMVGVYWVKQCSRWQASVQHNGKRYYAGHYLTAQEAGEAVVALRNKLFTHNDADRRAA